MNLTLTPFLIKFLGAPLRYLIILGILIHPPPKKKKMVGTALTVEDLRSQFGPSRKERKIEATQAWESIHCIICNPNGNISKIEISAASKELYT